MNKTLESIEIELREAIGELNGGGIPAEVLPETAKRGDGMAWDVLLKDFAASSAAVKEVTRQHCADEITYAVAKYAHEDAYDGWYDAVARYLREVSV